MNSLFIRGRLLDVDSERTSKDPNIRGGLLIRDGRLAWRGTTSCPDKAAEIIDCGDCYVTPSFIDLFGWVGGDKQQLHTEQLEAASGGFSHVLCLPHPDLPLSKSEHILWLKQQSQQVELLPVASMLEMADASKMMNKLNKLHLAGAVAFSQGRHQPDNNRTLLNCYEYLNSLGGLLIVSPRDPYLGDGFVTSGSAAWQTGLAAAPVLAETLATQRHLMLIRAAGVKAHFGGLSCAESVALLDDSGISWDISLAHLCFNEEKLYDYDNIYYTDPPLRSENERLGLCKTLPQADAVSSMHSTLVEDDLQMPMQQTRAGLALRAIVLPLMLDLVRQGFLQMADVPRLLALRPAQLLGMEGGTLQEGAPANITVFNSKTKWQPTDRSVIAANTPRQLLTGQVVLTLKAGEITYRL